MAWLSRSAGSARVTEALIIMKQVFPWLVLGSLGLVAGLSAAGCNSSDDGGKGGSGGSVAGAAGTGGSGGGASKLGAKCTADAQCGDTAQGWTCITEGLPNTKGGFCSKTCKVSDTSSCTAAKAGAVCVAGSEDGDDGLCFEGCDGTDPDSCGGRTDVFVACTTSNVCMPFCAFDSQCVTGKLCDPDTSRCVDPPLPNNGTKPIGAECDRGAAVDECKDGTCVPLNSGDPKGICTNGCDFQATDPSTVCGGDFTKAVCLGSQGAQRGLCASTCDCDAECASLPALADGRRWACYDFGAASSTGKAGICYLPPSQGAASIPTCGGGGGAGGAGGSGGAAGSAGAAGSGGTGGGAAGAPAGGAGGAPAAGAGGMPAGGAGGASAGAGGASAGAGGTP